MPDIEPLQTSAVRAAQLIWENGLLEVINRVSLTVRVVRSTKG